MPQLVEARDDRRTGDTSFPRLSLKGAVPLLYAFALAAIVAWEAVQIAAPSGSAGKRVSIGLSRGSFHLLEFAPPTKDTRAILLFGSGDGGWSGFEEAICRAFQSQGYEAIGIDFHAYARSDYNLAILQADFGKIAEVAEAPYGDRPVPVIFAGWSMGAAQAIAAAGGPNPPRGLAGLLLLDPCGRGRYGLRVSDESDMLPTGPGTFSMEDFAKMMVNLRVVQWHAAQDAIDSRAWLDSLTAPHRELVFAESGHYYNNDRADFLNQLVDSVPWILASEQSPLMTAGSKR